MNRRTVSNRLPTAFLALVLGPFDIPALAQPAVPSLPRPIARSQEVTCAPSAVETAPSRPLKLLGAQEPSKSLLGPTDVLVIDGGKNRGVEVGQQYWVRRIPPRVADPPPSGTVKLLARHTAGWLRIVEVQDTMAVAAPMHVCDGFLKGDYLEPFLAPPDSPPAMEAADADYEDAATLLFGAHGATLLSPRDFVVINRGSTHGLVEGQRLTLFRESFGPDGPITQLGEAAVVSVTPASSLARLTHTREAVQVGDHAAPHR